VSLESPRAPFVDDDADGLASLASALHRQRFRVITALAPFAPDIVLEITERSSLAEVADLGARLHALREMGYRIAVDDMRSGYSGFSAFAITPDFVKFDRALIQSARGAQAEYKLVSSITAVCRELGIATIAEGIEDTKDVEVARAIGCSHVRGFLLARPEEQFHAGPCHLLQHPA
jgi:EAL domain-containing protein (putative c-di-GMP-specific phosphodiesterase class I)